jgi:hypothetical protein
MIKRLLILCLCGFTATLTAIGCDGGGNDPVVPSDAGTSGDSGDPQNTEWPCTQADAQMPQFRVAGISVSEPAIFNALAGTLEGALDGFRFIWLIEIDQSGLTMTTGPGEPVAEIPDVDDAAFCQASWATGENLQTATASLTKESDGALSTTEPIAQVNFPVYVEGNPTEVLLVLPLRQLNINNLVISDEGNTIGTPESGSGDGFAARGWSGGAELSGWISFQDAQLATIDALGTETTLCRFLCGGVEAETNCQNNNPTGCENQPEQIPGDDGLLGYELVGIIAAGATTIAP